MAFPVPDALTTSPQWTEQDSAFFDGVFSQGVSSPATNSNLALPWDSSKSPSTLIHESMVDVDDMTNEPSPVEKSKDPIEPNDPTISTETANYPAEFNENMANEQPNDSIVSTETEDSAVYITQTDVHDNDVICIRGTGQGHPGNRFFRELILANKSAYDLMTLDDRMALSEQMYRELHDERGARILRSTDHDPNLYEVLDHERSVKKIFFALRDCRRRKEVKPKTTASTIIAPKTSRRAAAKQVKWKADTFAEEDQTNIIQTEISTFFKNETLLEAMTSSWKDAFDDKKNQFEEQLLHRYNIASQRGIPPKAFTIRLLNVLLKEIKEL